MAGKKKIGVVIAADGEKEFRQALTNINNSLKVTKSETAKVTAEYEGQRNTIAALAAKQEVLAKKLEEQKQKQEAARAGLEHANKTYASAADRLEELKKVLDDAKKKQEEMKSSGTASSKELKDQEKAVENYADAISRQQGELTRCDGKIKTWQQRLNTADRELIEANREIKKNAAYLKEAEEATDGCAKSIDKFGKEVKSGLSLSLKDGIMAGIGSGIAKLGVEAAQHAGEAAKYVVDVGSSFEAAMSEVAAISGAAGDEIAAMEEKAKALGASTKFSATEVAEAFKYMSLAGWGTADMISGIDGVLNLAAVSGMDLADASDMLTDYLSAFGMEASNSAYMADLLASAQANSNTTAEQLGEAYKNCAANMNAAGQDIETTTSFLEAMANQGTKGSKAGTQLSAIMRDITAKMKDGKIAIGDTSVEVADANGNFRDLTDILTDVEAATEGMGTAEKKAAMQATFTADSINGLSLILNEGMGKISGYEESLRNSSGAAKEMADVMNDNLKGDLTEAGSALEGLGIAAYEYVDGPVRGVVQGVTEAIKGITDIITPQKTEIDGLVDSASKANDELEKTLKNAAATMDDAELEAWKIETLGAQLISLNSVEDKSLAQKHQLKAVVQELGEQIPEIAAAYDEQSGSINLADDAIRKLIGSTKELAIAQAAQNAMQEVAAQLIGAQVALGQAQTAQSTAADKRTMYEEERQLLMDLNDEYEQYKQALQGAADSDAVAKIEANYTNAAEVERRYLEFWDEQLTSGRATIEEYNAALENVGVGQLSNRLVKNENDCERWIDTYKQASGEVEGLTENVAEAEASFETYSETVQKATDALTEEEKALSINADSSAHAAAEKDQLASMNRNAADAANGNTAVLEENTDALEANAEAANANAEAQQAAAQHILDAYNGYVDEIKSDLQNKINLFEKFDTSKYSEDFGDSLTVEDMTDNLNSQIQAFKDYQASLEAVKEHVGKEISPRFIQYLEDMGIEGKNTLDHILQTFADGEPEKIKELNDAWIQSMDMSEGIAEVQAANRVAIEQLTGELGSTDMDFSELRASIDAAAASAAEGWAGLTAATAEALQVTIDTAQQCGIKIPEGLADGISNGEISPETALEQLKGSIQGTFDGLAETAKTLGIGDEIVLSMADGIENGGQDAVDAITSLAGLITGASPELQKAVEDAVKTDGIKAAVQESVEPGAEAVTEAVPEYQSKAEQLGEAVADGIRNAKDQIRAAVEEIAAAGREEAGRHQEEYAQAGEQLGRAVSEGLAKSLSEDNGALILNPDSITEKKGEYETAGQTLGESTAAGLKNTEKTISDALAVNPDSISGKTGEYQAAGQALGESFADGMGAATENAGVAGGEVSGAAVQELRAKQNEFQFAGQTSAQSYANAIKAQIGQTTQSGNAIALAARNAVASQQGGFYSVGANMAAGVASGINSGAASAINAAASMASQALAAAKRALDIHSPSKKFREQVGQQIPAGMAFGIKDKASLAGKQASKMSAKVYTNATAWLAKYKKSQQVSLQDEKWYWQQVVQHTKAGTSAYNKAMKKIQNITIAELQATGLSSAVASKVAGNFGVSKTTGSGKKKKTKDAETYYGEIYSAAEKYAANQQILNEWSLKQELAYWTAIQGQLKKGTQAWYDATKQVNELKSDIAAAEQQAVKNQANIQKDILDKYKVYYKVSARAEMDYWNIARSQFKAGTDERIEADRRYLEAQQEWYEQRKDLDEDYADSQKEINNELAENVKDLQDAYRDAVEQRKQDILSSMNLFEAWDAEGYTADTLIYNLKTQVAGLALWEQQLDELGKKGLASGLMDELKEMGPEAAANIYALNQMTAEQLAEYNRLWEQKNALAQSQAVKDNEGLRSETNAEIAKLRTEAQAELNMLNADYRAALQELNEGIDVSLRNIVNQAGRIGEDAVSGLIGGINRAADSVEVYNSTTQIVETVSGGLAALEKEGGVIGGNTLDGLLAAMTDYSKIQMASKEVVQSIKRAIEDEAEIHSPARLFRRETGPQIPAGVAEGMIDGTREATRAAREMVRDTVAAAQGEMQRQQEMVAELDFTGIARLNRLTESYQPETPTVNVDNSGVAAAMDQLIDKMVEAIRELQIVLDSGTVIGELQPGLSRENAMAAIRRNRGR